MSFAEDWAAMITIGRVIRPHGNRGQVVVEVETHLPDVRFRPGATVFVQRGGAIGSLTVQAGREQDGRWIVGFEETTSIDEAEVLRGLDLRIPAAEIGVLESGRYYVHDLVGCAVETTGGTSVGVVTRVEPAGGAPLLVVGEGDAEIFVPFAADICRQVDPDRRRIVIEPPEGLLDLNRT
jgi:16S rRNA processing protein RimM